MKEDDEIDVDAMGDSWLGQEDICAKEAVQVQIQTNPVALDPDGD